MWDQMQKQQMALNALRLQSQQTAELSTTQAINNYAQAAEAAMSKFRADKQIDDESIWKSVVLSARNTHFADQYMNGIDPLTGAPVKADPYQATLSALEAGYLLSPETRQLEVARRADARARRDAADAIRKEKLGGVSGAAGSVPRTQNAVPSDPRQRHAAMVAEIDEMMFGVRDTEAN
jgi:hypothetical protein